LTILPRVEGDDPRRGAILPVDQILDCGGPIGVGLIGLAPGAAEPAAEVIQNQVNIDILWQRSTANDA
jgi:hypothetical protein